jgi:hypothetical protein
VTRDIIIIIIIIIILVLFLSIIHTSLFARTHIR